MKQLFNLLLLQLLLSTGFNSLGQSLKGRTMSFNYGQFLYTDTLHRCYIWDKNAYDYAKEKAIIQIIFKWTSDTTVNLIVGKDQHISSTYIACRLTAAEKQRVPKSILNGQYKLAGVYEHLSERGSGMYEALYLSKKNMIMVSYVNIIGFMEMALLYMHEPKNDLKEAGFQFPYIYQMEEDATTDTSHERGNGKFRLIMRHAFTKH